MNTRIIIYAISAALLAACSKQDHKPLEIAGMMDAVPVQTQPDGRWGMMSPDGRMLFENEFVDRPCPAINRTFTVVENGAVSVYTIGEQPHLLADCENLLQAGYLNEGLMPMARAEGFFVVDDKGKKVCDLKPIEGKAIIGASSVYSNSRLVVSNTEGLYGCVDTYGNTIIPPKFAALSNFSSGYAVATMTDGKDIIVDRDGNTVQPLKDGYKAFSKKLEHDEIVVTDSAGHLSFFDIKGKYTPLPDKVKAVGQYNANFFTFRDANDFWGVMERGEEMSMMMRPKFRSITVLDETGIFLVNLDGVWSVINHNGRTMVSFPTSYTEVVPTAFSGAIKYFAHDPAGWVLLDINGEEIKTNSMIYGLDYSVDLPWLTIDEPVLAEEEPTASIADEIASQVSPNTLCGIQLNAIGTPWYRKQVPDSLADTNEFVPDSIPVINGLGNVKVIGVTDRVISIGKGVDSKTGKIDYIFTPSNSVVAIEMDIPSSNQNVFLKSKADLIKKLQETGFRMIDDSEGILLFRSAYANLEVGYDDDEKTITVLMYRL